MATDTRQLQGEVVEHPDVPEANVEKLLHGFLKALLQEQGPLARAAAADAAPVVAGARAQEAAQ